MDKEYKVISVSEVVSQTVKVNESVCFQFGYCEEAKVLVISYFVLFVVV